MREIFDEVRTAFFKNLLHGCTGRGLRDHGLDAGSGQRRNLILRAKADVKAFVEENGDLCAEFTALVQGTIQMFERDIARAKQNHTSMVEMGMLFQGEKPEAWLDVPIDVSDYEIIDLFNWQNSVKDMISQIEFVQMVDVQSETVERYIKDGKVKPDLSIPFGDKRMFHYFREESIRNIAKQYGWDLITPQNMADKFMKFIETMDMSYSYKPVLLKAIYEYMDSNGRVALPDVVDYFIDFYEDRKAHGMIAEKSTSIYQKGGYTRKDVEKNILSNPFKRFEDMRFLMRCKDVETIEVNPIIFRKLTREDWLHIVDVCDKSLEKYYLRIKK